MGLFTLLALLSAGFTNLLWSQNAFAEPWLLEADRITHQNDPQQVIAEGGVTILHNNESAAPIEMKADTATYLAKSSEIDARGNVSLTDKNGTISADTILMNIEDQTGKLTSTTIALTNQKIRFNGKLAEKVGENRYVFHDGTVTSCQTEDNNAPAWSINWKKADITLDGMAVLQHATFKIKKIPLLYVPYIILPAKTTRQTGFLWPEMSHSNRGGSGWTTPFFVNISPSNDLTLYPGYYEKRGVFAGIEFRHVNDQNSKATLSINYQKDRSTDNGPPGSHLDGNDYRQDGFLRTKHDRFWLRGKADQYFSKSSALHLDIDAVSDQDFLHEYRDGLAGFSKNNAAFINDFSRGLQEASLNFRESILQFSSRGQRSSGGLEVRYVDDPLADLTATEPAQTLPRILYSNRLPFKQLPFSFSWDSEYVSYRPKGGIGYQRVDLFPRLIVPLPLGQMVEGTIIGGFRETAYRIETSGQPLTGWNYSNSQNRNTTEFSTNIATILTRDFPTDSGHKFTHTFRPNLRYNYLDSGDQTEHPNLDSFDRLTDENSLTVELNNYFSSSKTSQKMLQTRQLGYLKLNQPYNLKEAKRNLIGPADKRQPFADTTLDMEISPSTNLFLRYQTALNHYGNGVSRYNLQSRYSNLRQDGWSIDYDYVKGSVRNVNLATSLRITNSLSATFSTTRSLLDNHASSESMGLIYSSQCWGLELSSTQESEDRRLMLTFTLTGIGETLALHKANF